MTNLEVKCPHCGRSLFVKLLTEEEKDWKAFHALLDEAENIDPESGYKMLMDFAIRTDAKNENYRFQEFFLNWFGTKQGFCKSCRKKKSPKKI